MSRVSEIIKEIGLPIWIIWSSIALSIVCSCLSIASNGEKYFILAAYPVTGAICLLATILLIAFSANGSIQSRHEWPAIKKESHCSKKTSIPNLDARLHSIEGIIGYLDQGIKMDHKPKNLEYLVLFLAYEIQELKEQSKNHHP